jgi:transposase
MRRIVAAAEASVIGYGGISAVSKATGISRRAITEGGKGLKERKSDKEIVKIRRSGGGRKTATEKNPELKNSLEKLVEPVTRGDPESPLRWTCKSVRVLSRELKKQGYNISHDLVARLLKDMGYSLQANRKTQEGSSHPDRNAQFNHINAKVIAFQSIGQPVISVDTKKKELVGNFRNRGHELRPKRQPEKVRMIPELGKVNPYGVYDVTANVGWVNVGVDHDTSAFAVESIRRWWYSMGIQMYSGAKELLITADSGGSNGYRVRLWKWELQKLSTETGLSISVCHLPPGTSKWNKIEHRQFNCRNQNSKRATGRM